jgi:transposase
MPQKLPFFPLSKIFTLRGMAMDFIETDEALKSITVHLKRDKRFKKSRCSKCGGMAPRESRIRKTVRDMPLLDWDAYLDVEMFIVKCPDCGRVREKLDFIDKCSRLTVRLEAFIFNLVSMSTVKDIADYHQMSWETVKNIDKKYLAGRIARSISFDGLEYLSIDEIANKKGHDYLTIVLNLETGQVIWVGEGRKEENINRFFEQLSQEQRDSVRAVCIDMWPAYIKSIRSYCQNADIVFDKFHILKKFGEVVTKLRSAEYRKAETREDKDILKGTKWLLLKNKSNLNSDGKKQLKQLLELNENLSAAYILKEELSHLWDYKNRTCAKKFLDNWISMAEKTGIRGIRSYIKMLRRHEYGILNHCEYPIDNGKIEGTNNKIKTLKRRAYGFHDTEYFKLKILQACRGKVKKKV